MSRHSDIDRAWKNIVLVKGADDLTAISQSVLNLLPVIAPVIGCMK